MQDYPVTTYCIVRTCKKEATHEESGRPLCDDHCNRPHGCSDCGWFGNCEDFHACQANIA